MDTQLLVPATVQSQESLTECEHDGDGSENITCTKCMRVLPKFITITSARIICHMLGNFSGAKFLGITPQLSTTTSDLPPLPSVLQS